ncbi:MAG: MMPL family transporter [Ktedonobacterales bacterium]
MFRRLGLRMVRWRYWIVGMWTLAVLVALPFAPRVAEVLAPGGFSNNSMESQQAINVLQKGLNTSFTNVQVVFSSKTMTADNPRFVAEAQSAVANLNSWSEVDGVIPFSSNPTQISRDRHVAYTVVLLKADPDSAPSVLPDLRRRLRQPADLRMLVGGAPVFYADIQSVSEDDLRRAEEIAFPFAIIALLLVFRSVIAAGLPAAIGGCSVVVSLALLYLLAQVFPVSIFALNITTLFGLGLGVDYSLFMVSRFREELKRGHSVTDAVGIAMSTAGRAVFFSGLTVSIGLLGLLFFPLNMLRSVGIGGVITVLLSILAAVTLLPALLSIIGTRINALPVMLPRRQRETSGDESSGEERSQSGFWHQLATAVMRHPLAFLIPVLSILLLLGAPFLSVRLSAPDASILPTSVASRQAYDLLEQRFDQSASAPIIIAVETKGSPLSSANLVLLDRYVRTLQADPRVEGVMSIVSLDPRLSLQQYQLMYSQPQNIADPYIKQSLATYAGDQITMVQVTSKYPMLDTRTEALVEAIRGTAPPPTMHVLVDGSTAGIIDYVDTLYDAFPFALLVIAIVTYLVLMVVFRSLVLPLKAILMNLLSILASYGALVLIFQEGNFHQLLNFTPLGYVEASSPILMFCALFGLSMDYEVFLLSRIREAYEQTGDNVRSIALGMERSGGIITSAAAIVILVSLSFASADMVLVKALGVGMAIAVFLDATLVRGLLVPATMRLLGDINWWWPAPFNRLLPSNVYHQGGGKISVPGDGEERTRQASPLRGIS